MGKAGGGCRNLEVIHFKHTSMTKKALLKRIERLEEDRFSSALDMLSLLDHLNLEIVTKQTMPWKRILQEKKPVTLVSSGWAADSFDKLCTSCCDGKCKTPNKKPLKKKG